MRKRQINERKRLHAERYLTLEATRGTGDGLPVASLNGTANDLSAINELITDDYQNRSAMKPISGRNAFRQWVAEFQTVLTSRAQ